jgi:hypothetical protein
MKHLGSDPRSIFPFAKVGLTAHRKTGPPGFDYVAFSAALGIVKRACLCSHLHENCLHKFLSISTLQVVLTGHGLKILLEIFAFPSLSQLSQLLQCKN